jgi:hypothetical protein
MNYPFKIIFLAIFTIGTACTVDAQTSNTTLITTKTKVVKAVQAKVTNSDAASALKDLLLTGAKNASGQLSAADGFFGNNALKILLPPEAVKVENTVRKLGFGQLADNTILYMNRAAESASAQALPIFINAIKGMSIEDGIAIVNGGNNAATNFLKAKTSADLTNAFRPVIEQSLNQYNVASYWNQLFSVYNKLPTTMHPINPDLTGYVADKALNGLFTTIAQEENKLRTDPKSQITSLLQRLLNGK